MHMHVNHEYESVYESGYDTFKLQLLDVQSSFIAKMNKEIPLKFVFTSVHYMSSEAISIIMMNTVKVSSIFYPKKLGNRGGIGKESINSWVYT